MADRKRPRTKRREANSQTINKIELVGPYWPTIAGHKAFYKSSEPNQIKNIGHNRTKGNLLTSLLTGSLARKDGFVYFSKHEHWIL